MARQRLASTTDVTDAEWPILKPLLPPEKSGGRPRPYARREVSKGSQEVLRGGGAWRLRPPDRPPWPTAEQTFRAWRQEGTWLRLHDQLRAEVRPPLGDAPPPLRREQRCPHGEDPRHRGAHGDDGAKHVHGRTRHRFVDTTGLRRRVLVQAADVREAEMAPWWFAAAAAVVERLRPSWTDMAARGQRRRTWVEEACGGTLEIVERPRRGDWYPSAGEPPPMPAFPVLPRRWVVERPSAWIGRSRRLRKDEAYLPASREALIDLAISRLLLRRLARQAPSGVPSPPRQRLSGLARAFSTASSAVFR